MKHEVKFFYVRGDSTHEAFALTDVDTEKALLILQQYSDVQAGGEGGCVRVTLADREVAISLARVDALHVLPPPKTDL